MNSHRTIEISRKDLRESLRKFGIPDEVPLEAIPWQYIRHIGLNLFKPSVDINIGNKKVPFYVNPNDFEKYYNKYHQSEQFHFMDPRYRFFGKFYQTGDDSTEGYLSGIHQTQNERTTEEVEGIIRLLRLEPGSSICDCPCGIGRHSIELAKKGHRVLAVDLNFDQLQVGIENAKKDPGILSLDDRHVIFLLEDMLTLGDHFNRDGCFHVVINMFYSLGFFQEEEKNEQVIRNFYNLLAPGGKFLMHTDVNMASIRSGKYKFEEDRDLPDGKVLKIIDHYDPDTKRINGSWQIDTEKKEYSVRVYEVDEFVGLCKKVGFQNVEIYSDWLGNSYNETSEMIIFVAEK